MNASFLSLSSPPLVSMIQCRTSGECIEKIRLSLSEGAEAFGVQLCQLAREERTEENCSAVFRACENKPIYVTSYRYNLNIGLSDEECTDLLIKARLAGATLLDVPADWFDANECQVTDNPEAVEKQKELIAKLHGMGAEVLLSTHDLRDLSAEE
ncbi:MAG: hypothetical protein MJ078_05250, partial [Clostridia bacterium]|nr:hypothetical protein [Clostridia bacterium]